MDRKKIIIDIPFNVCTFSNKRLTKKWINQRILIFMKFTLQSLKIQTNQDFIALIQYDDNTRELVKQALANYDTLPRNVKFVSQSEHRNQILEYIRGYEYLYLVRLDSDDMYHKSFIQQLHEYKPKENTIALINQSGYLYNSLQNRLAKIHFTSPPFYTLIYKVKDYIGGKRYKLPGGHPSAIKVPHEILEKANFVVVIHSNNDSTSFKLAKDKDIIVDEFKIKEILKEFMGSTN